MAFVLLRFVLGVLLPGYLCGNSEDTKSGKYEVEVDHYNKSYPLALNSSHITMHTMLIRWSMPDINDNTTTDLYNFIIYHHKRALKGHPNEYEISTVPANQTFYTLENLEPGTMYSFYVVANYTTGHQPASHTFSYTTIGYGPDRACACHPVGSFNTSCNRTTGQCYCQGPGYEDRRCEVCAEKYYWNSRMGCQPCPNCDLPHSNGTCYVDRNKGNQVLCTCHDKWGGAKCERCAMGFFKETDGTCVACNCFNNSNACDQDNGICHMCKYNTTGEKCQACLPGYVGDAVIGRNCTKYEDVYREEINTRSMKAKGNVIMGVCIAMFLLVVLVISIGICRRVRGRKPKFNFWTVELKDDHEQVNFSQMMEQPDYNGDLYMDDVLQYHDRAAVPATTPTHERPPLYRPNRPRTQGPYQTLEDRHREIC